MTHPMLTWFEAQLADAQQIAEGGYYDSWHTKECGNDQNSAFFGDCTCDVKDRVLALVASQRAILAIHEPTESGMSCDHCSDGYSGGWPRMWPCPTVRALVSAFAGRPGYLGDWSPT